MDENEATNPSIPLIDEESFEEEQLNRTRNSFKQVIQGEDKDRFVIYEEHPYQTASLLSKVLFNWTSTAIKFGQKNRFGPHTLGDPYEEVRAEAQKNKLLLAWNHYKGLTKHAIMKAIWHCYRVDFTLVIFLQFICAILQISQPILVMEILIFIEAPIGKDGTVGVGITLVVLYFLVDLSQLLITMQVNFLQSILGIKCSNGVTSIIYDKILKISSATNKKYSEGEIINFIEVDVSKIEQIAWQLPMVSKYPIQLLFSVGFLFYFFGVAFFVAISKIEDWVLSITSLILIQEIRKKLNSMVIRSLICIGIGVLASLANFIIAKLRATLQARLMKIKDKRMRGATETVNSIKVIKLYSWQDIFIDKIFGIRDQEIKLLKLEAILDAIDCFIVWMTGPMLILSTFLTFFLMGNKISLASSFAAIQVFVHLDLPVKWLPEAVRSFLEFVISMNRIQNFLYCHEVNEDILKLNDAQLQSDGKDIQITNSNFMKLPSITHQNLKGGRGVVCERSKQHKHIVKLGGHISLVQQTPWIQNMTIRDNILFGLPLEEERYNRTIQICQLVSDLDVLNGGDLTEIGEKGINLSGGQKARISLARAVYTNSDIILMDDPISALDSHVRHKVFEEVFCGELQNKTRVLVTHAVDFIEKADRVAIMEKGKIKYIGTYEEVKHSEEIQHIIQSISETAVSSADKEESKEDDGDKGLIEENSEINRKTFLSKQGTNITEDENEEILEVPWSLFIRFFTWDKNWIIYTIVLPLFLAYAYCATFVPFFYGKWIERYNEDSEISWGLFTLALMHPIGYAVIIGIIVILIMFSSLQRSKKLHNEMFESVIKAPINLYFDKTQSGKILNRFSNDINIVDSELPRKVIWTIECYISAIFSMFVSVINTLWALILIPIVVT